MISYKRWRRANKFLSEVNEIGDILLSNGNNTTKGEFLFFRHSLLHLYRIYNSTVFLSEAREFLEEHAHNDCLTEVQKVRAAIAVLLLIALDQAEGEGIDVAMLSESVKKFGKGGDA